MDKGSTEKSFDELLENETIIYRIINGLRTIYLHDTPYHIKAPSKQLIYQSQLLAQELKKSAMFNGWLSREEIVNIAIYNELISQDYKTQIEKIHKSIDDLKLEAYEKRLDGKRTAVLKRQIKDKGRLISQIMESSMFLDRYSVESYVEVERARFLISPNIYDNNWKHVEFPYFVWNHIVMKFFSAYVSATKMRELARSDDWRSMWNISKDNVFGVSSIEMTDDQRQLIMYSKMYDSAYSSGECPPDFVIEDDILFDGWRLFEAKRYEEYKKGKNNEDDKLGSEVYQFATSKEHAQNILEQNTSQSRKIIKERQDAVNKAGKLREYQLPDKQGR